MGFPPLGILEGIIAQEKGKCKNLKRAFQSLHF
jgi:hypothetical protein